MTIIEEARLFISQNPDCTLSIKNTDTRLFLTIKSESDSKTLITIDNPTLDDEAKVYFLKKKIEGEING